MKIRKSVLVKMYIVLIYLYCVLISCPPPVDRVHSAAPCGRVWAYQCCTGSAGEGGRSQRGQSQWRHTSPPGLLWRAHIHCKPVCVCVCGCVCVCVVGGGPFCSIDVFPHHKLTLSLDNILISFLCVYITPRPLLFRWRL